MEKSKNKAKIIFHIDMNAFFCSVAEIYNPALRNTAFAIGRENSTYGVISTASYEARKYGIHSGMSLKEAYNLLPTLNVVSLPYDYYLDYHKKFVNLLEEYTNLIEIGSIDEAYIDMTECSLKKHPLVLAKEIQTRILQKFKLPCSIGIAPTLFLAKMASDLKKPLGISVLRKREVAKILYPLPVKDIFGIGKKTYPKFEEIGIDTIGKFVDEKNKSKILKIISEEYYQDVLNRLSGKSRNYIEKEHYVANESISTMQTYDRRLIGEDEILYELRLLTKEMHERLIKENYLTRTISITLRDLSFKTITRSKSIDYTNDFYLIYDIVTDLFIDNYNDETIRLLGVGFSNLIKENLLPKDYNLFNLPTEEEKRENITKIMQEFQKRFGNNALFYGKDSKNSLISNTSENGVEAPEVIETERTLLNS